jgi:hypothetical protein
LRALLKAEWSKPIRPLDHHCGDVALNDECPASAGNGMVRGTTF